MKDGLDEELQRLIDTAWGIHKDFPKDLILEESFPILYFGDLRGYQESDMRVVTVGLNPSEAEFPANRFPDWARVAIPSNPRDQDGYEAYSRALDSYFRKRPYLEYFEHFERLLRGYGSSYTGRSRNVAIHTDICFPVATARSLNEVLEEGGPEISKLEVRGGELWMKLLCHLKPHRMLISAGNRHIRKLGKLDWQLKKFKLRSGREYSVEIACRDFDSVPCAVVSGRLVNKPFGTLGFEDKELLGAALDLYLEQDCNTQKD